MIEVNVNYSDIYLANYLRKIAIDKELIFYTTLLLLNEYKKNNTLLRFSLYSEKDIVFNFKNIQIPLDFLKLDEESLIKWKSPSLLEWKNNLLKEERILAKDLDLKGYLFLDYENDSLYTCNSYSNSIEFAELIRNSNREYEITEELKKEIWNLFIDDYKKDEFNEQLLAVINSLRLQFSVISGGPGTGKTYTLFKIIYALLYRAMYIYNRKSYIITIAGPTGKSVSRIKEELTKQLNNNMDRLDQNILNCFFNTEGNLIVEEPKTIHRLLGYGYSKGFVYNEENKLKSNVIICDESSMIDEKLSLALLKAINSDTQIILLGDSNQLSAVESGSYFGELCSGERNNQIKTKSLEIYNELTNTKSYYNYLNGNPIYQHIVFLTKSRRYDKESIIGKLSKAVLEENKTLITEYYEEMIKGSDNYKWIDLEKDRFYNEKEIKNIISEIIKKEYNNYRKNPDFETLNQFRVLTTENEGSFGTDSLNLMVEEILFDFKNARDIYNNKPIIINRNNYILNIYNGDTAIINKENNNYYIRVEKSEKKIPLAMISDYSTAFVMTIHKSQGSEFDGVMMIIPPYKTGLCIKELLYTGITRAKKKLYIVANLDIFLESVFNSGRVKTGIIDRLRK